VAVAQIPYVSIIAPSSSRKRFSILFKYQPSKKLRFVQLRSLVVEEANAVWESRRRMSIDCYALYIKYAE